MQGQVNSYIELRKDQEGAQVPTASRLNEDNPAYDTALAELATLNAASTVRTSYETKSPGSRNRRGCVP